ncbi:adenylyl-sulfate kinase [Paraburkholderia sp. BCC1884]|uniref:adenylyl-sulfate kinase n=1 Tax=Paraburkholderia sp. BCC1884 TaxID=2562668 RepID=UPI001182D926|nr:adenylyl-sulfate kinase [Paraburkholderia sp. BCC1884]
MKRFPYTLWLTGLSAAGKSTLAFALADVLTGQVVCCEVLDGDVVRRTLSRDLGFSREDRSENIRRVAQRCRALNDAGTVAIAALISPFAADRTMARDIVGDERFIEVYLSTPLVICEARDPKGLYLRAHAGQIANFTGVSDPYEAPLDPELSFDTSCLSLQSCVEATFDWCRTRMANDGS